MWLLFRAGHSRQCDYYSELGTRVNVTIIQSWALATMGLLLRAGHSRQCAYYSELGTRDNPCDNVKTFKTHKLLLVALYLYTLHIRVRRLWQLHFDTLLTVSACLYSLTSLSFPTYWTLLTFLLPEDSFSTKFSKMTYFLYSMTIFYLPTYQTYLLSLFQRQSFHLQLIKHYLLSFLPKTILFSSNLSNSTYFPSPQAILSLHNIVLASTLFSKHL